MKHQIMDFQKKNQKPHLIFKKHQCSIASAFTKHRIMQVIMIWDLLASDKAWGIHTMAI